ncbi:MAG TPA: peptidylprolyl isomerase [Steroidobacteraceae bacterium]|nr:peptidylprolyl isomerase [Steroidobacteraceae bacterium]
MNNRYLIAGVAALLTISGCAKNSPPGSDSSVATVNGKAISKEVYEAYVTAVARRPVAELTAEQKTQVLDQLVAMQVAAEMAEKNATDKKPEIASQIALARMNVLSESVIKKYMDEHPTTDAEIKAEYDTQVAAMPRQYHARHVLVDSKAAAESVIERLKKGGDFAKIAEKESSDGSKAQGGDLGWFALSSMVPEFGKAVSSLEKGKFTEAPVQTQYGWHVIKLEDFRSPEAPAFEQVKDQVTQFVQRKKLQTYMQELRKTAKVEKINLETAAPAAAAMPAPPASTAMPTAPAMPSAPAAPPAEKK